MRGQTRLSINNNDVILYRVGSHWSAKVININKEYDGFVSKKTAIAILTDLLPYVSCETHLLQELREITQQYKKDKQAKKRSRPVKRPHDRILSQYEDSNAYTQIGLVLREISSHAILAQNDDEARDLILEHLEELAEDDGLSSDCASLLFDALDYAVTDALGWDASTVIQFEDERLGDLEAKSDEIFEKAKAIADSNISRLIRRFPNLVRACDSYAQVHRSRIHRIWES
ncbi:hypothetical protein Ple7327_3643 [Pleurocapsa sp. PCC 7327]|nr:hypothetical protein Ple7327_3643 [Pleurocapsa sp. PCC 7327]